MLLVLLQDLERYIGLEPFNEAIGQLEACLWKGRRDRIPGEIIAALN